MLYLSIFSLSCLFQTKAETQRSRRTLRRGGDRQAAGEERAHQDQSRADRESRRLLRVPALPAQQPQNDGEPAVLRQVPSAEDGRRGSQILSHTWEEWSLFKLVIYCTSLFLYPFGCIDYRCKDGRFPVSASCLTISNTDSRSSSETGVNHGIRSWNIKHSSDWAQC